jgi:hypothetical protein
MYKTRWCAFGEKVVTELTSDEDENYRPPTISISFSDVFIVQHRSIVKLLHDFRKMVVEIVDAFETRFFP